jgi:Ni/Co efflux regulator RcnB
MSTFLAPARYSSQVRYWITPKEISHMKKLLVALIAAAFAATAFAQAPKSEPAPAAKTEKSDKKAKAKTEKKAKAKSEKKSTDKKAAPADKKAAPAEKKDGK